MTRQPSVKINGYEVGDHPCRRIVWAETEGLLEATKQSPWASFESFAGSSRNHSGDMDYPTRHLSITVRLIKQGSFLSKHEALASLSEIFSGQPTIVQVGSLYLEAEFVPAQVVKDAWTLSKGYLTVRFEGEAIPGTFWGSYGYEKGRERGIIVQDDRPDHPSSLFTGSSFTLYSPGTAPTEATIQVANANLPNSLVYLKGAQGQMMPINLDSTGYGMIDEAYGFLLYPGKNRLQLLTSSGESFPPLEASSFKICFHGTRFRHIGNTDNRFADDMVLQFARTAPATYIGLDGQLRTVVDGEARIGLPGPLVKRNLLAWSQAFDQSPTWNTPVTLPVFSPNVAVAPDGSVTATIVTDNSTSENMSFQQMLTIPGTDAAYTASIHIKKDNVSNRVVGIYLFFIGGTSVDCFVQFRSDTGTYQITQGSGSVTVTTTPDGLYWRVSVYRQSRNNTTLGYRFYPAHATALGNAASNTPTGSVTIWGAQVDPGAAVTPYQPTNATSLDYSHPLLEGGLVLEGKGRNHLLHSNDLSNEAAWPNSGGTVARTAAIAPDGSHTAWVLTDEDNVVVEHMQQTASVATGTDWFTTSFLVKKDAINSRIPGFYLFFIGGTAASILLHLRTDTGAHSIASGSATVAVSPAYGGDWWRVTITKQAGNDAQIRLRIYPALTATLGAASDPALTGSVTVAWPQIEPGPFATSHIPSGGMAGVRNPDLCGIVHPQNELIHSHDLTQEAWEATPGASVTKIGMSNTLSFAAPSDAIRQTLAPPDVAGLTWTLVARLRLGTLSGSVQLRLLDQAGAPIAATTINTSALSFTDARTFMVTGTPAASATGLRAQLIGDVGTGSVIVESLRLVRGNHPGIEVQTLDTPLPAPPGPPSSGSYYEEFEYLWPYGSTPPSGVDFELVGERFKTGGLTRLGTTDASSHAIRFWIETDVGLISMDTPNANPLFDGHPHKITRGWTFYRSNGVAYVDLILGIDDQVETKTFTVPGLTRIVPGGTLRSLGTVFGVHRRIRSSLTHLSPARPDTVCRYQPAVYEQSFYS